MIRNKYLLGLMLFVSITIASSTNISGQVEYFYMTRLENSQLVNIPFRLLDLNVQHQVNDNFNIFGNIGIEYRSRRDTDFMTDSNLEDFLLDIRELYMSIYIGSGEARIGKQIHSWGSVDENSPIDNLNAYDYYYLLLGGAEKKLGAYSLAYDNHLKFLGDCKFSFVYSPMHNASRIPINDPDYPIGLPEGSSPSAAITILSDNTPEFSANMKWLFNFGDISFSYLNFYDRIFNLTAVNVYQPISGDPEAVPFYSYRLTKTYNVGAVFLFDDFTLSFDYANLKSEDQNDEDDLFVHHPISPSSFDTNTSWTDLTLWDPSFYEFADGRDGRVLFNEKVKYSQLAIQFEMPFENNFKINGQYFKHNVYKHEFTPLPIDEDVDITNLTIDLETFDLENIFIPGVGTPYAMITSEAVLLNFEKGFPDNDLIIDFNAFIDMDSYTSKLYDFGDCLISDEAGNLMCDDNSPDEDYERIYRFTRGKGMLLSIEFEHDLGDGFELSYGMTKIFGNDDIENYNFSTMESFSSFRSRITYYF